MKVGKIVGIVVVLALLLVAGAAYYLFSNIESIVKRAVETEGPKITSTNVDLGAVDIELVNGRAELSDFQIANPEEFTSPHLFEAEKLVFNINPRSIRSDVIVIDEIVVEGVKVTAEQKGLTTNIQAMLKAIQENLPRSEQTTEQKSGDAPKFMVRQLRFADSGLRVVTESHGEKEFVIPAIEAANLGSKSAGLTPAELGVAILKPYLERARSVAQDKIRSTAEGELKDKAEAKLKEKLGDDADKALDTIKGLL